MSEPRESGQADLQRPATKLRDLILRRCGESATELYDEYVAIGVEPQQAVTLVLVAHSWARSTYGV